MFNLKSIVKFNFYVIFIFIFSASASDIQVQFTGIEESDVVYDYDIIYVRYDFDVDVDEDTKSYVNAPQGEEPYSMEDGADLVLLKPNGDEIVLVDCGNYFDGTDTCSATEPTISFDGKTVYYSLLTSEDDESAAWLYKIKLDDPAYTPIRLTFDDGFDSKLYAANTYESYDADTKVSVEHDEATKLEHDQGNYRAIRDMSPIQLEDGRLLFVSNRSGLTALNPGTNAITRGSVLQLYTMDDHDGELDSAVKSRITRLETGTLHVGLHPIQLKDGRILFSTWQDVAQRFQYAMTVLFVVNPDGTNLQQFTEPHDHHKNVEHFATQMANEDVITGSYYPSFDFGYGIFMRYPINHDEKPGFIRDYHEEPGLDGNAVDKEFARKNLVNMTPHTTGGDEPAPEIDGIPQGKYSMPAVTKDNHLLVSYSTGYVNHFGATCDQDTFFKCEDLKSGIYLIKNADDTIVNNANELILIKDDLQYNEMWPKPVLSYEQMYGDVKKPITFESELGHTKIPLGQAAGLVGTSSMYNRETSDTPNGTDDGDVPFQAGKKRETFIGGWRIQGTDVGIYTNDDIYGVRLIGTPAKPFTKPVPRDGTYDDIQKYLIDTRLKNVVARYGSFHGERWEILGEFPLTNKGRLNESGGLILDGQGNPDSSWVAKIPAETPFLIQTIDANGMTLNSELSWRGLKSGEVRTDCGGCHAHSIESLDFDTTESAKNLDYTSNMTASIMENVNLIGIDHNDPKIRNAIWDLTQGSIPLLESNEEGVGVKFIEAGVLAVEFNRDVKPIIESKCTSCHTTGGSAPDLILDGSSGVDAYDTLSSAVTPTGGTYYPPQQSQYIRVPQARESLLTWVFWGERLDGRDNGYKSDDIDYSDDIHNAHLSLHESSNLAKITDLEKRTVARWIDLGGPIDFPETDGMGYTEDNQLPIINITKGDISQGSIRVHIGTIDVHSAIDWSTLSVKAYPVEGETSDNSCAVTMVTSSQITGVSVFDIAIDNSKDYLIEATVRDLVGNKNVMVEKVLAGE